MTTPLKLEAFVAKAATLLHNGERDAAGHHCTATEEDDAVTLYELIDEARGLMGQPHQGTPTTDNPCTCFECRIDAEERRLDAKRQP